MRSSLSFIKSVYLPLIAAILLFSLACESNKKNQEKGYAIKTVALQNVDIANNSFWGQKLNVNRTSTIPHILKQLDQTKRLKNLELSAIGKGTFCTAFPFDDTDVYKMIEAASFTLMRADDPQLDQKVDSLISRVEAAQQEDGYIYSMANLQSNEDAQIENHKESWWGNERWQKVDVRSHELYNAGHLIEAAVAHHKATNKNNLLKVAIKFADLIRETFGPADDQLQRIPGHQEIELALVKLYTLTGDRRYLDTADFFLELRGTYDTGSDEYRQNHKPVKEQTKAVGHSVRAAYMYSGMADVGAWTGDQAYIDALNQIWQNIVSKKLYIIGGIGATGQSEGFGPNYVLPNATSYNETCAAISNVFWNHRMYKLKGDAKYYDVLERALYNNVISGVSLDGDRFFYPNRLKSEGDVQRQAWFSCACCPPNAARTIASMPEYIYGKSEDTAYVNLFAENTASFKLAGTSLKIRQETRYPWNGKVKITVEPEKKTNFTMKIRIPGWARNKPVPSDLYHYVGRAGTPILSMNGEPTSLNSQKGYATIKRSWSTSDTIELDLPMNVRSVVAHDSVKADSGKFALERGPLVYAFESIDNGKNVLDMSINPTSKFSAEFQPDLLDGVVTISGKAKINGKKTSFKAIPYYSWANRGKSKMTVWLKQINK